MSDDGKPPETLESMHLAMIDMWINTGIPNGEINALILNNFDQLDFEENGVDVMNKAVKHLGHSIAKTRDKCFSAVATNTINVMKKLKSSNHMPRIVMSSGDLQHVPGIAKTVAAADTDCKTRDT